MTEEQTNELLWANRAAHELSERLGAKAHLHAASLVSKAAAENDDDGHRFWGLVEAALRPR